MATLYAGTESAVRMDTMNIGTWLTGSIGTSTPNALTVTGPGGSYRQFGGAGFTYASSGPFIGGTITSIYVSTGAGGQPWGITGMSMPVATLNNYVTTGNTIGFLQTVFAGNDTLSGHNFFVLNDYLDGFGGHDKISGGAGDDTLRGNVGNDTLDGQSGIDSMDGGAGNDSYYVDDELDVAADSGASGIDTLYSTAATYALAAGSNIENITLLESSTGTDAGGNELANKVTGNSLSNLLWGDAGADIISGGKGDDWIFGDQGNDTLYGGDGNDAFQDGPGADRMEGGQGDDTFVVHENNDVVVELAGAGTNSVLSFINYVLPGNVENLALYAGPDMDRDGTGNALNNVIEGNGARNVLNGLGGADTLIGYLGNDTYVVDNAGDVVDEDFGDGFDLVKSSVSFNLTADGVHVSGNVENLTLTGAAAIAGTGNNLANHIVGNGATNTLSGLDGNDILDGGGGGDKMVGGNGNDIYYIDNVADTIVEYGAQGNDWVFSPISVDLSAIGMGYLENVYLTGTANSNAAGNSANNMLVGNGGANKITGASGEDSLYGADGNDTLDGEGALDKLYGGNGNDTYYAANGETVDETGGSGIDTVISLGGFKLSNTLGNVENLTIGATSGNANGWGNDLANKVTGNDGNNKLYGEDGNDTVNGGNGMDSLEGGLGNDLLNGGGGDDLIDGGKGINTINVADGNDLVRHQLFVDAYDVIQNFDGNAAGGQDVLDLDEMFDALGVNEWERDNRVQLADKGASVDVRVDTNGDGTFDYLAATIYSANAITIGQDVLTGSEGPIEVTF